MADSPSISEVAEKIDLPTAESKGSGEVIGDSTDQNSGDEASQYMTGVRLYTIIGGLTMVAFLMMLDSTIVTTALPSITGTFNSVKDIGWYGSAYLICICTLQPLSGKFYQFYSSKLIFLGAVAVFELGSLLCALAKSSTMFIIGRAVAGCGGAGVLNGAFTIIAAAAPLDRRPKLLGIMIGIASIGVLAGPIIGGALTEHVTWRWCFYLNLPIGGITIFAISFIKVPDAKIRQEEGSKFSLKEKLHRLDLPGFSLFAPSIAMLLLALEWGGTKYSWNSSTIIGLFCGAGGTFLLFLGCEYYRREEAMLPLSLFRNRVISCAVIATAMSQGGVYLIFYYLPTWFQVVKGQSPTSSGIYLLPSVGAMSISTALAGALVSRIGYYTPFIIVGSAGAAVAAGLMTTLRPSSGAAAWVCYQLLNGAAQGFIRQQPITAVQAVISKDQLAVAISLVTFCQMFGSSLFISFGQLAFANSLKTSLGKYAPEVDASKILNAGATNFRSLVPESSIPGIILAYNHALTTTFYIAVGTACTTFVTSFGLKWINLKAKKKEDEINREVKGTNTETKKDEV